MDNKQSALERLTRVFNEYLEVNSSFWRSFSPDPETLTDESIAVDLLSTHIGYRIGNAVIAKYLQKQSNRRIIAILPGGKDVMGRMLAQSFGFSEIFYLDECQQLPIPMKLVLPPGAGADEPMARRKALLEFSYDGVQLGDLAYDSFLRNTGEATITDIDETIRAYLGRAVRMYLFYENIIKNNNVRTTVQGHIVYDQFGSLARAAVRHGALVYGRKGAASPLAVRRCETPAEIREHEYKIEMEDFRQIPQAERAEFTRMGKSYIDARITGQYDRPGNEAYSTMKKLMDADELRKALDMDERPIVCIMTHAFPDAPHTFAHRLYSDYHEWLVETIKLVVDIKHINWLIKPHPEQDHYDCPVSLPALVEQYAGTHDNVYLLPEGINTLTIMKSAIAIITVSGTAGLEFATQGIPVILAGDSTYSGLGFTVEPQSEEEYRKTLESIQDLGPLDDAAVQKACLAAYLYFSHHRVKCVFIPDMPGVFWVAQDAVALYRQATEALQTFSVEEDPLYQNMQNMERMHRRRLCNAVS